MRTETDENAAKESLVQESIPSKFSLKQNYPNPFNPVTHITFLHPEEEDVTLSVFNSQGQLVSHLVSGRQEAGTYQVLFDGTGLASGIFFYRLSTENFVDTKRMLLIK